MKNIKINILIIMYIVIFIIVSTNWEDFFKKPKNEVSEIAKIIILENIKEQKDSASSRRLIRRKEKVYCSRIEIERIPNHSYRIDTQSIIMQNNLPIQAPQYEYIFARKS